MMKKDVTILIVEDDEGHFSLINRNLYRAGIWNETVRFVDGQQILDFLFSAGNGSKRQKGKSYLLLLDIRIPKIDGVTVLKKIKQDNELKKIPVIVLTTTNDPRMVTRCHNIGCSLYIVKPVEYNNFIDCIRKISLFLATVEVPRINGQNQKEGAGK